MESNNYLRSVLKGLGGTIILSLIGVLILSILMKTIEFSSSVFSMLYVIISLVSLALGSVMGAKANASKGWLVGLGIGLSYYLVLFIISSYIGGAIIFQAFDLAKCIISVVVGLLAGMLGINL
ncbi:TIGR04086 family membrane protein [Clostridium uliginosum]|uniref:Putative membrane protein, TIGR04086 family n=1 Tax=Clostridium uliginosum TaxID=119641 RepID=A0A1I1PXY9_9CLOT|nr:TIGR04086 family membrane protein [Clostridium uliginosum]SFD11853.1 putative membrane protein, TIGR04086 family [Clostridium uliginosum]